MQATRREKFKIFKIKWYEAACCLINVFLTNNNKYIILIVSKSEKLLCTQF